jgi:hypothetical protein
MKRVLVVCASLLALLGIAASVEHLVGGDHYKPGFVEHPLLMQLHVISGGVYLGLALVQFVPRVRARWPRLHRTLGLVTVASGVLAGATALVTSVARVDRELRSSAPRRS